MPGWPTVDDLKLVLDVVDDHRNDELSAAVAAGIAGVKRDVGLWDEDVDEPDDSLFMAALRRAEMICQRPEAAVGTVSDPTYNRLLFGHRRSFGIA